MFTTSGIIDTAALTTMAAIQRLDQLYHSFLVCDNTGANINAAAPGSAVVDAIATHDAFLQFQRRRKQLTAPPIEDDRIYVAEIGNSLDPVDQARRDTESLSIHSFTCRLCGTSDITLARVQEHQQHIFQYGIAAHHRRLTTTTAQPPSPTRAQRSEFIPMLHCAYCHSGAAPMALGQFLAHIAATHPLTMRTMRLRDDLERQRRHEREQCAAGRSSSMTAIAGLLRLECGMCGVMFTLVEYLLHRIEECLFDDDDVVAPSRSSIRFCEDLPLELRCAARTYYYCAFCQGFLPLEVLYHDGAMHARKAAAEAAARQSAKLYTPSVVGVQQTARPAAAQRHRTIPQPTLSGQQQPPVLPIIHRTFPRTMWPPSAKSAINEQRAP